jgi:phosphate-selective porin OprO/OprP
MIHSAPTHQRRNRLKATLLASILFATPAFAASDDAKTILQVLLSKGVITQKDFDATLDALNSKLPDGVSPVQFVQDALGVQAKEVQKAVEFTKKDEKNGSVRPSGFGFVSADGQNSINLIGQVHFDVRSLETGLSKVQDKDAGSGADSFEVRRARLGFNGTLLKDLDYEVLTNLVGSNANLLHRAFINYSYNKDAQIRVGRFKQPFSLEEQTSANAIDFQERSYGNQLVPAQRLGAMIHGAPTKGFTYALSLYQDGFNEVSNTENVGALGVGRVTLNLAELRDIKDAVLHFGVGYDKGSYQTTPTVGTDTGAPISGLTRGTVLAFRSENRGIANIYRAQISGDVIDPTYGGAANNVANVNKELKGLEIALATGPWKFQSEYFDASYNATALNKNNASVLQGTANLNLTAKTDYYELVYNITGENWAQSYRNGAFSNIRPKSNFGSGGTGAWQVGWRLSSYKVGEPAATLASGSGTTRTYTKTFGTINGNTSRGENSATATTNTIGVNWILNPNARVIFNYAETKFGNKVTYLSTTPADVGFTSKERVASVRTQLIF